MRRQQINYDNPVPDVNYNVAVRETFLVSGRPHDHHAHSMHSTDCKQGQFQMNAGGAIVSYGTPQEIVSAQGIENTSGFNEQGFDSRITSGIPLGGTANCGPISPNSELYRMGHPATGCPPPRRAICEPRSSCQEKIHSGRTHLPPNNASPYRQYDDLGAQRAVNRMAALPGMLPPEYGHMQSPPEQDTRYKQNVRPLHYTEGFHGEWGRGLYDSGLAGRHFVTTQRITKVCACGRPGCTECPYSGGSRGPYKHDEMRTEYTMRGNEGGVCDEPMGFCGDGYRGQFAFMPSGYEYNSYSHPYDEGAFEKYGTYVADYATGTNTAKGPVVAQQLTGPLRNKNIIMQPGTFKTINMPGSMDQSEIMHNAFATNCDQRAPTATMYKYPPQGVLQTNISIFDNFIS